MPVSTGTGSANDPIGSTTSLFYNQNQTHNEAATGTDRPYFTNAQLGAQGNVASFISNLLNGGQLASNFQAPNDATRQAAWNDFRQYQLPQLAAVNGAGSPTLGAAAESLNLKLAALGEQNYNTSMRNALDAFNMASAWAFQPVGQDQNKSLNVTENTTGNQQQIGLNLGNILAGIGNTF